MLGVACSVPRCCLTDACRVSPLSDPERRNNPRFVFLLGGGASAHLGTHLGHNLPDKSGNRYCINLVLLSFWLLAALCIASS